MLSTRRARHARPSSYTPRHARPSQAPARIAAVTAAGGFMLPMAASSPAHAATQTATVRVAGPSGAIEPGAAPVSVRLMSDGQYVHDGIVEVQIPEGTGWRTIAKTETGAYGLGKTSISVSRDTRVRAHYRGSATQSAATSSSIVIDVESFGQRALAEARQHNGKPYRYGAVGPNAFDCSGFTKYVFSRLGKNLPHNARDQRAIAQPVSRSAARVGDLVFMDDNGHVGIYAGDGMMWDSPRSGKTVSLRRIYTSTYAVGRIA